MPRQSEYTANQSLKQGAQSTYKPVVRKQGLELVTVAKWIFWTLAVAVAVSYVFMPLFQP